MKGSSSKNATTWRRKIRTSWSKKVKGTQEILTIDQKDKFDAINLQQVLRTMVWWETFIGTSRDRLLNPRQNTRNRLQSLLFKCLLSRKARTLICFPNQKLTISWGQIQWLTLNNNSNMTSSRWCQLSTLRTYRMCSSSPKASTPSHQTHLVKRNNGLCSKGSKPARCSKTSRKWSNCTNRRLSRSYSTGTSTLNRRWICAKTFWRSGNSCWSTRSWSGVKSLRSIS